MKKNIDTVCCCTIEDKYEELKLRIQRAILLLEQDEAIDDAIEVLRGDCGQY